MIHSCAKGAHKLRGQTGEEEEGRGEYSANNGGQLARDECTCAESCASVRELLLSTTVTRAFFTY